MNKNEITAVKKNLTILLLTYTCLHGQPGPMTDPVKLTFYYNINWELTTPEKSLLKREAYFDLQDMVFDGVYQDYNKENKLIEEGYYAHGKKSGIQTEHFDDQSIKSTIEFSGDDFIIWQLVNDKREYEIAKGTGKFSLRYFYFFDYYLKQGTMTGEFRNGKRVGVWVYRDLKKAKTDVEYYKNGALLDRTHFTQNDSVILQTKKEITLSANAIITEALDFDQSTFSTLNQYFEAQINYPSSFQRNVTYPGGLKHLLRLLTNAGVPDKYLVLVKLKIDEHGQVGKASIVRSVDSNTDARVVRELSQHLLRFCPAMKNGKAIASTIYLPVSGGEEWEKALNDMPTQYFLDENNFF